MALCLEYFSAGSLFVERACQWSLSSPVLWHCDCLYQDVILNEDGMRSLYQGRVDQQRNQQAKIEAVCAVVSGSGIW